MYNITKLYQISLLGFFIKQRDTGWHDFGTVMVVGEIEMNSLKDKVQDLEEVEIIRAMAECNWIMAKAARKLGITERIMGYKIKKYGIRREGEQGNIGYKSAF